MSALTHTPKYSLPEIERTLLVDPALLPDLSALPFTRIDDRYLHGGRLRLRAMTDSATGVTSYKLGKKYGASEPYVEPIVNIYLDANEYAVLAGLPAHVLSKRRYRHAHAGHVFSIDVFEGAHAGLILCEAEAPTLEALLALSFPPFAERDVTAEPGYSGWELATQSRA